MDLPVAVVDLRDGVEAAGRVEDERLSPVKRVRLISEIAGAAATPDGMVAGQAGDLEAESRDVTAAELEQIHRLKTGALIIAAARSGARSRTIGQMAANRHADRQ